MARLTIEQQSFLVDRMAAFDTPSEAATTFEERFGFAIEPQHAIKYNPETLSGHDLGAAWKLRFEEKRRAFIEQIEAIPIAHRAYRMRRLHEMEQAARREGDRKQAAALIDQAAKEIGAVPARGRVGGSRPVPEEMNPEQTREALRQAITAALDTLR